MRPANEISREEFARISGVEIDPPKSWGDAAALARLGTKPNKYGAQPKVYRGRRYASKLEARHAAYLDTLKASGYVAWWIPQVKVPLTEEVSLCVDFLVARNPFTDSYFTIEAHEVKGFETADWKIKRKLWDEFGPFPLVVWKDGRRQ